ncbi:hypothetical protein C5167_016855 [Papaver somniferum]|uniref:Uncharacterized protein n=1 Tax=Papaver somniferum TaxID=3469 RepID=A0A4Y7ILU7_PAPSO|nr:hypothetical protein C5167_016855 [Papaver somniferum]
MREENVEWERRMKARDKEAKICEPNVGVCQIVLQPRAIFNTWANFQDLQISICTLGSALQTFGAAQFIHATSLLIQEASVDLGTYGSQTISAM